MYEVLFGLMWFFSLGLFFLIGLSVGQQIALKQIAAAADGVKGAITSIMKGVKNEP